jgi:phenylpropionate dioxygenase-like ring-hydroxylating dioxygenase large terminal subunit
MKIWQKPNSGYYLRDVPSPDAELTRTDPNTPMGELMRRFWQPVCLAAELTDLPLAIRILGEDLVAFRDKGGRIGVLARHCTHRGTSLEYGIISERGLRCCYHGWLFDTDGTILETPGEPPASRLKERCMQGAYPAREYEGLIFAYMGPPEQLPEFPLLDTYAARGNRMVPYSVQYPCNWLQVKENFVDPAHAYFLHSNITTVQFSDAWAQQPTYDFAETPDGQGMYYITVRRVDDRVWVRSNHIWLPNCGQVGALLEKAEAEKFFHRVSITRWTVPIDDTNCWIIGWRHFNDEVDPFHEGKPEECGRDTVDFYGQTGHRSYE